jgi:hypothetical protein
MKRCMKENSYYLHVRTDEEVTNVGNALYLSLCREN